MYLSNSNAVSQPLPSVRNYNVNLQVPACTTPSRTVVTLQTSVERTVYTNAKGPMQLNQNLQVTSGVIQNLRLNSSMMNSTPPQIEATVSHQTHLGTNLANSHTLQTQHTASDTYSMQLQATQNSARVPVPLQGNQGLLQLLTNRQVDWPQQHVSDEPAFLDYRPLPKQHSYPAQSFIPDPTIHKNILMPSVPSQSTHNQLPTSAPSNQATALSYQYSLQSSTRPPLLYNCRYGSQPMQNVQHVTKNLSVEVPQNPETHSSEAKKDFCQGFQQQWQSTNDNLAALGNFRDIKFNANVRHFSEPTRSVDGVQTSQNNQEKRVDSCNPTSSQGVDTAITKEKLARDIKSLVEIKKKFSELARKIKINKDLLIAAGCKSVNISLANEPAQRPELLVKDIPAKTQCSMELVKTCLNLWKDEPSKMAEEKASNPAGEKQATEMTDASTGMSKPPEVPVENHPSIERNPQNKAVNPLQEATLSMLVQNYEPSCANVAKGTELQIAVVSPLILSNVIKEITPGTLPEPVYPVIKEGSICSLQNQPAAENAVITAALKVDVTKPVVSPTSAKVIPLIQKEKQNEPSNGNLQDVSSAHVEQGCGLNGLQTLPKPKDRALVSDDLLQIENICSLVEGDVSYNSKIAKMFSSSPLKKVKPSKVSLPSQQVISTAYQKEPVEPATESKDSKYVQYTDFPYAIAVVRREEKQELVGSSFVEPGVLEESNSDRTPEDLDTPRDACYSPAAAAKQDISSEDFNNSSGLPAQHPAVGDSQDHPTCLHDQLSELLKEFPYGIEGLNPYGSFVSQKTEQVSEDQSGGKVSFHTKEPTDQLKITVLSSEQMKELFPEQDEPRDADTLQHHEVDKSEPPKKKCVTEVESQCDPLIPPGGENPDCPEDTDKIYCCALGWLAMIYEGVPKCRCNIVEVNKEEVQQAPWKTSNCEQGQQTITAGVTAAQCDDVSPYPKTPPAAVPEKSHLTKKNDNNIKDASEPRQDSTPSKTQLPDQVPPKCKISDKDACGKKCGALANEGQELNGQLSSKDSKLGSSQRNKGVKLKFHEVKFQSSSPDQASKEEGPLKKHTLQNSDLLDPKVSLFPSKDPCRKNGSYVQSSSEKKLKSRESCPQEAHFEKRKLEQEEVTGLEMKKRRSNKEEQNKNTGVTYKSCDSVPNPNEQAIVRESTLKSSDFRNTGERPTNRDKTASQSQLSNVKDTRERVSIRQQTVSKMQASDAKDTRERATVRDKAVSQTQASQAKDTRERITAEEQAAQTQVSDAKDTRGRATVSNKTASQTQAACAKDTRERNSVKEQTAQTRASDVKDTQGRTTVQERSAPQTQASDAKDGSCRLKKVITLQEYFQRKRQNGPMAETAKKICLENVSGNFTSTSPTTDCAQVESCGRLNGKGGSSLETLKKSSNVCANCGKDLKAHLAEESKTCALWNQVKGRADGKQPTKTKVDKTLCNISNEMSPQSKEQRKSYLNRVNFRCTERERICLSTFTGSSWKLGKRENQEHKPTASFPGKDSASKPGLLEFKLCPDVLLKNTNSAEDKSALNAYPEEQVTAQVSGIKSSRKDWIKCVTEKTMQKANQENGVHSRLLQRSASTDGREAQQNLTKESRTMFQTYKQMYLQKRGGDLGSSPIQ